MTMRDDLPWPPWLEDLPPAERIRAIVAAVAACIEAPAGPGHEDGRQHCTPSMAGAFLEKLMEER